MRRVEKETIATFFEFCYVIWEARNARVFQGYQATIELLLSRASSLASSLVLGCVQQRGSPLPAVWSRPIAEAIKMNVDVAWSANNGAWFCSFLDLPKKFMQ